MQPIKHTKTLRLSPLKMYRTDLDELVSLFEKYCTRVEIADNQHRYESLDEMKKHVGAKIKDLDISGENPSVHFLLNQKEVTPATPGTPASVHYFNELRTEEISDDAETAFLQIKEFISAYQRPSNNWLVVAILFGSVISVFATSFVSNPANRDHRGTPGVVLFCTLATTLSLIAFVSSNSGNYLSLDTKLGSPSFFERKKDDLILGIFIALFGAALGVVGTLITQHFTK